MKKKPDKKTVLFWLSFGILVLAAGIFELTAPVISKDVLADRMIRENILRALCSGCVLLLLFRFGTGIFGKLSPRGLLLVLPFVLVAVCNFPFFDRFGGRVSLERGDLVWLFTLYCLLIGIFEELLFRGLVFPILLERFHRNRKELLLAILYSSALFGLFHIFNLFGGGAVGPVLLQICYSFGIGAMLCMVLLCTRNIWPCVLIHAGFDFAGLLYETLGKGLVWSLPTVLVTAASTVVAVVWGLWLFFRRDYAETVGRLLPRREVSDERENPH